LAKCDVALLTNVDAGLLAIDAGLLAIDAGLLAIDAGLLARSQYLEGPVTGHLDTGFSWFPCVYKRMLRWFPSF
jgi:hypothetical protein